MLVRRNFSTFYRENSVEKLGTMVISLDLLPCNVIVLGQHIHYIRFWDHAWPNMSEKIIFRILCCCYRNIYDRNALKRWIHLWNCVCGCLKHAHTLHLNNWTLWLRRFECSSKIFIVNATKEPKCMCLMMFEMRNINEYQIMMKYEEFMLIMRCYAKVTFLNFGLPLLSFFPQ